MKYFNYVRDEKALWTNTVQLRKEKDAQADLRCYYWTTAESFKPSACFEDSALTFVLVVFSWFANISLCSFFSFSFWRVKVGEK